MAKKQEKVPLIPMPIIEEPFRQIAIDVVGPLPKTRKGNQYILAVCDYAARYTEAFPLRTFTAPMVAEKLIKMFACYGIPQEILTDKGTNFTSQLYRSSMNCLGSKRVVLQEEWYDMKAREMELKEGDQVLLLLPDSTEKFQAKWRGPYEVKKKLGKVNYEIMML